MYQLRCAKLLNLVLIKIKILFSNKKLYQKWGINDTTYLLGQDMSDVLGDDGVFYNQYRDCYEQEKHKKKMLEDFDFFTKAENMKDFFNALQIKELKKYAHFVF